MNFTPCITNVLHDVPACTIPDEHYPSCHTPDCKGCWPREATRGEVCERCYDRIDHAIGIAAHLRAALAGVEHAVTAEGSSNVPGPRLPLSLIHLDFDALDRAQGGHTDPLTWVQSEMGAAEAVRFVRLVRSVERSHPTVESERKLQRLRCPRCSRLTATWQPPDWPGDDVTIACISCGWEATNPDSLNIVAEIESKGSLDNSTLFTLAAAALLRASRTSKGAA